MSRAFAERLSSEQEESRLALWRAGLTDRQIAATLGLQYNAVKRWRQSRGLAANPEPRKPRAGVSRQKEKAVSTVDPVTRAAATCDAMAAARLAGRGALTDFPVMLCVEIPTGRILVDQRPWWLRRLSKNAGIGH